MSSLSTLSCYKNEVHCRVELVTKAHFICLPPCDNVEVEVVTNAALPSSQKRTLQSINKGLQGR